MLVVVVVNNNNSNNKKVGVILQIDEERLWSGSVVCASTAPLTNDDWLWWVSRTAIRMHSTTALG